MFARRAVRHIRKDSARLGPRSDLIPSKVPFALSMSKGLEVTASWKK